MRGVPSRKTLRTHRWLAILLPVVAACANPAESLPDAGGRDAEAEDRGVPDAGELDSGSRPDAGALDAEPEDALDAEPEDAGLRDAAPEDAGSLDAELQDAARLDAAPEDAGPLDAEPEDAAQLDAASEDAGPLDAEPGDAAPEDAAADAGSLDAAPADAGFDAGIADSGMLPTTSTVTWSASDGLPDQACAPWVLADNANPEDPIWNGTSVTVATSANSENMYYYQGGADLILPATLVMEASARLISGSASTPSRAPTGMGFRLGTDRVKNILHIEDGLLFLLASENTRGPSIALPTTDMLHTYRIEAELTVGGTVEVYRDGVLVLTGATFSDLDTTAPPLIYFGEASVVARGISEWGGVTHNAHAPVPCP